jgi:hypothetical protein
MSRQIPVSELLASLQKRAKITVAETRILQDETTVHILVGRLPKFPHGGKPTWYPLIVRKGQTHVDEREVEAIQRHFWQYQLKLGPAKETKAHRHTKSVLKRS